MLRYDAHTHTGKCVVAGNVRRTAEIAFGNPNDTEYIDLKGKLPQKPATASYFCLDTHNDDDMSPINPPFLFRL